MATFNHIPSSSTRVNSSPRVRRLRFGKGYIQRAGDGINNDPKTWSMLFDVRSNAVANQIEDFFEARAGHESFNFTIPGGIQRKYICPSWSRSFSKATDLNTISATFEEVFEA